MTQTHPRQTASEVDLVRTDVCNHPRRDGNDRRIRHRYILPSFPSIAAKFALLSGHESCEQTEV